MSAERQTSGAFPPEVFLDVKFDDNMIANGVLRYAVLWLYHGVLFFLNVIWFHGTRVNITSFTPVRKGMHFLRRFSPDPLSLNTFLSTSPVPNFSNLTKDVDNWAKCLLVLQATYGFHWTDFHTTHQCSTADLYRVLSKSVTYYEKYGYKFSTTVTQQVFTELTLAKERVVKNIHRTSRNGGGGGQPVQISGARRSGRGPDYVECFCLSC
jgi:hypothetical protein